MAKKPNSGPSPFDYLNQLDEKFWLQNEGKGYNAVVVNLACSHHADMVLAADELNTMRLTPHLHYTYLVNTVRKRKRPPRWPKTSKEDGLEAISKHYECSLRKARQIKRLLSEEFIQSLVDTYGD